LRLGFGDHDEATAREGISRLGRALKRVTGSVRRAPVSD
jgi:hypothetical protein